MCGQMGLLDSARHSILTANYMTKVLSKEYEITFKGENGRVAHEFIIDLSDIKKRTGISEEDVAKRLMDYGFHAPTQSWPHVGGLMVEPTESEDKLELDRFMDALLQIRKEIREVEEGKADKVNNLLKNAPHTLKRLMSSDWDKKYPYSRERAGYPAPWIHHRGKVWPAVGRVDSAYGDRNLVCTCPSVSDYFNAYNEESLTENKNQDKK